MKHKIIAAVCLISAILLSGCSQAPDVPETTAAATAPAMVTEGIPETTEAPTTAETDATEAAAPETGAAEETACAHKYHFKVTKEPTCSASGERLFTCTLCGASYREVIPPLDHAYVKTVKAPDCVNSGCTTYRCKECGDTYTDSFQPALGHDYGPWIIEEEPTEFKTGLSCCTCRRCGERETMVIPQLTPTAP